MLVVLTTCSWAQSISDKEAEPKFKFGEVKASSAMMDESELSIWREFRNKKGNFKIHFPGVPEEEELFRPTGPSHISFSVENFERADYFSMKYYPKKLKTGSKVEVNRLYDAILKDLLRSMDSGKEDLIVNKEFVFKNTVGRDVRIEGFRDHLSMRIIYHGGRVYRLEAESKLNLVAEDSASVMASIKKFFESFDILK